MVYRAMNEIAEFLREKDAPDEIWDAWKRVVGFVFSKVHE